MSVFIVEYVYPSHSAEQLADIRPAHRDFLSALHDKGINLASGPWAEGAPGALLIIRANSAEKALEFLNDDPFYSAGLIAKRNIREWTPVIGSW
ncbi:MAG: hypothetical protein CSA82_01395 [Actinobacteria bacterium]|nr:MAG: hypothetical protein CSA82_01395 [Actinomycetota bacterium]